MKNTIILFVIIFCCNTGFYGQNEPIRIGIDGLTHSHVHGLLDMMKQENASIKIVGISEKNDKLVDYYAKIYGFDKSMVYNNIEDMIAKTKPQGVMAFNSIYEHLSTVEACAPKGIHVMVEKPLAVSMEHADKMAGLALKNNVQLLTNYETTWYASNHKVYETIIKENAFGDIRKVIVCDGHEGPIEIGIEKEFAEWLTDPIMNGGGAVIDFGCYGVNLTTWLMNNELPLTVSATLQQIKPDIYPKVDDEATIILTYPKAQAIVQGSWNWTTGRKDIEVYAQNGYIKAPDANNIIYRNIKVHQEEMKEQLPSLSPPKNDPYIYFAEVIKGNIEVSPIDLSSLENNLIVIKVLDAARTSAKEGKVIKLK